MNIFIADGHYLSREGIKNILSNAPKTNIIGEAVNKNEVLQAFKNHIIDLLIIDPKSVLGFKLEHLIFILNHHDTTKVLIIGSDYNQVEVLAFINSGITSFVTKQCSKAEIEKAIDFTMIGEKFFCNKVLEVVLNKPEERLDNCNPSVLTERETEIIKLIGEGFTTIKIAQKLKVSVHTINTHRKNISKKLKINTPAQMVKYAVEADF